MNRSHEGVSSHIKGVDLFKEYCIVRTCADVTGSHLWRPGVFLKFRKFIFIEKDTAFSDQAGHDN